MITTNFRTKTTETMISKTTHIDDELDSILDNKLDNKLIDD